MEGRAAAPWRVLAVWCALLVGGALLLSGRYDFTEAGGRFAREAYLSTLYYLLIVPPLGWAIARRLGARARLAWGIGVGLLVVSSAPYRWLGLGHLRRAVAYFNQPRPDPVWFPAAISDPGAPHERALLVVVLMVACAVVLVLARGKLRRALPGLVLSAAVVLQAGLHTSTRSPYTFIPRVESSAKPWYRLNLFDKGQGAVNGDAHMFTSIDDHFKGVPNPVDPWVLRRSFVHWLGAHASYFVNPYYVYLALNIVLWILGVVATWAWARRIASPDAALFAAALAASLTGFIVYVAQPMSYLAALAALPILLWALEAFLVDQQPSSWGAGLAFGGLLGLAAATYDIAPLVPFLGVYGWLRRIRLRTMLLPLAVGMAIYLGWPILQHRVLGVPSRSNLELAGGAISAPLELLRSGAIGALLERVARGISIWSASMVWAFAGATTVIAAFGFALAPSAQRRLLGVLLLPSLLLVVLLVIGNTRWGQVRFGELPRFVTISWPPVILAAGLLLERLRGRFGRALPWLIVGGIAVLHNAGAFGFVAFDYHFYWPTPIGCDPYGAAACTGP